MAQSLPQSQAEKLERALYLTNSLKDDNLATTQGEIADRLDSGSFASTK